jgi:hypothetical protein
MNGLLSSPSTPATRLDTDTLIGALEGLRRFLSGQKATLVWDGLAAHRSKPKRAWLGRQRSWLVVEPPPGYPPELNPVEPLGASQNGTALANLAGDTLEEIIAAAERGIQRIRATPLPAPPDLPKQQGGPVSSCTRPSRRGSNWHDSTAERQRVHRAGEGSGGRAASAVRTADGVGCDDIDPDLR